MILFALTPKESDAAAGRWYLADDWLYDRGRWSGVTNDPAAARVFSTAGQVARYLAAEPGLHDLVDVVSVDVACAAAGAVRPGNRVMATLSRVAARVKGGR